MVDSLKFKTTIISYFTKNDFRIDLLAQKLKSGGHLMNEWLQEAKIESMDNSLHDLLYMPIQRLIRYPLLIKDLINSLGLRNDSLKHDIHLSLIKVNQLIAKCNNQPSVTTWKELKQFESEKSSFFPSRSLAINDFDQEPLATADDMKLTITGKNSEKVTYGKVEDITKSGNIITRQKGDYTTLIHIFKEKYQNLKNLETGIISLKVTLLNFMKSQLRYSDLWLLFLDEENPETDKRFITSIYSSFSEKLKHQMELTLSIVDKIDKLVIQPLAQALECCDDVRALVKTHRKYRSAYIEYIRYCGANSKQGIISQRKFHKAQTCIKIENSIKEKVPRLLDFQDEFVVAILASLNEFCCNWYFVLIGQRSFDEYNRLLGASNDEEQLSAHQDIVSSYKRTLFLTKLAIMEASDSYPDHAFFFA
ncbi:uncharacterized protein PRCAT00005924001 [Priceomyces carsonii]|uniref:uncharacterized protein n=1 Tax=Priceomyces carsonii TaxID=28549 RepID=UPI002ED954A6|nr:unnamed protein product [Priceomyces carsonii]